MNADHLSQYEQQLLLQKIEENQREDFKNSIISWTSGCFNSCVDEFTSKVPSAKEEKCVKKCFEKSVEATKRISMRFAEHNAQFNMN